MITGKSPAERLKQEAITFLQENTEDLIFSIPAGQASVDSIKSDPQGRLLRASEPTSASARALIEILQKSQGDVHDLLHEVLLEAHLTLGYEENLSTTIGQSVDDVVLSRGLEIRYTKKS